MKQKLGEEKNKENSLVVFKRELKGSDVLSTKIFLVEDFSFFNPKNKGVDLAVASESGLSEVFDV